MTPEVTKGGTNFGTGRQDPGMHSLWEAIHLYYRGTGILRIPRLAERTQALSGMPAGSAAGATGKLQSAAEDVQCDLRWLRGRDHGPL